MLLTKIALEKPITVTMLYLAIIVIAVYAVLNIPLSLLPNLNYPRLTIVTYWSDASPEEVEANITSPIEAIGSTIPNITKVKSTSYNQRSVVSIEFARNTDMDFVRFELNEKLQLLHDELPDNVTPRIREYVPREFSEDEFLKYGISGPYQLDELEKMIERTFKYQLNSIEGVSSCEIIGNREKEIKIILKQPELNRVSPYEIRQKLNDFGNKESISGFKENGLSYIIQLENTYHAIDELKNIKLNKNDGSIIRLGEIAEFEESYQPAFNYLRYNGMPQLSLTIQKKSTANALQLAKKLKSIIKKQKTFLPEDIEVVKLEDESEKISKDMSILYKRGIFVVLIIFVVLLIFLKHAQSAFLVLTTIFFSTMLTFILMFYLKIGLNILSLAGLTLGFGMMVDNSIVVYENIFRYQNLGYDRKRASILAVREISLPISASTLTTTIVFAPFLYMQGDVKIFYLPFVYAMVLSLLSSLFVSFTFIPLAAYKFLQIKSVRIKPVEDIHFNPDLTVFQKILKFILRFRWIWLIIVLGFLAYSSWIFINKVDKGFTWKFPKDDYLAVRIRLPIGSNIDQTNKITRMFEDKVIGDEKVFSIKTQVWTRYAYIRIDFDEETKQTAYPLIMREKLKAYATNFGNANVYIWGFGPSFGGGGYTTANFSIEIRGYNYLKLKEISENIKVFMQKTNKRVQNIDTNATGWWKEKKLFEYQICFNRKKLAANRMDIYTIINQVYTKINSAQNRFYRKVSEQELAFVILDDDFNDFTIEELKSLIIKNNFGSQIKLNEVAEINKQEILAEINREDELYTRRINFDFRGSYKKGKKFIEEFKETFPMTSGYSFIEDNDNFSSDKDKKQLFYLLVFAILLVYTSLCSLYESFKYPFIILLTLPLAFTGVALIFYFTGETFNSYARIGLILLAGIVVNNSIILVDHMNKLRIKGFGIKIAILQAARDRIRPILMTSLTTIAGLIPMLIATDIGKSDFWRLLSLSTIGGLITSTFFVLSFIPVMYYFFTKNKE
ncbi:MAG: efflux RND transporter permease subunit [Candidatus Cloacimonetes bacterium]|nr:efflux RND transporter permease subunit [Candidatus Cloacimonadota bacterium]